MFFPNTQYLILLLRDLKALIVCCHSENIGLYYWFVALHKECGRKVPAAEYTCE